MRETIFFETDLGDKPVEEFLVGLDASVRAKVVRTFGVVANSANRSGQVLEKNERIRSLGSPRGIRWQHLSSAGSLCEKQSSDFAAWLSKEIAENAATGYGNCSAETEAVFSATRLFVKDDLQKFHETNIATDPQYAIARQLLDLGEAVARLREERGLTRGELGKQLRVKAADIAVIEEETPRAPAGVLEAALSFLVTGVTPNMKCEEHVSVSLERIRRLRSALIPA
jgi:ribosome-binding protein aMBF1 (putative translation factor)